MTANRGALSTLEAVFEGCQQMYDRLELPKHDTEFNCSTYDPRFAEIDLGCYGLVEPDWALDLAYVKEPPIPHLIGSYSCQIVNFHQLSLASEPLSYLTETRLEYEGDGFYLPFVKHEFDPHLPLPKNAKVIADFVLDVCQKLTIDDLITR